MVTNLLDEPLRVNAPVDLAVDENSIVLTGGTWLNVTTDERGAHRIEYRLADGAAHEFVEVTDAGEIRVKQAPDYETTPVIGFAVEARYVHAGQDPEAGWQGRHDITLAVTNVNDTPTVIEGGATRRILLAENTGGLVYRPDLIMDDAVTSTIWTLSGEDADLFTVDQRTGAVRFREAPDFEAPRDRGGDNRYEVKLSVTTSDAGGRQQTASQNVEINVTDVSVVMEGGSERYLMLKENHVGTFTTIRFYVDESDFEKVEVTLKGEQKGLFKFNRGCETDGQCEWERVNVSFQNPPNFETKHLDFDGNLAPEDVASALYLVDVVITTIWADGTRKSATKSIWINLQNQPEAPKVGLERDPGFYILTTEWSMLRDTGYRVSAIDDEGDEFTLTLSDRGRFRIRNDNEIWIRKKRTFDREEAGELALEIQAKETGPDGRKTILPFTIPIKPRLDNIDDMFRIGGIGMLNIDENLPSEAAAYTPAIVWGDGYESRMPVIWSLHGADRSLLRIDPTTGSVRFVNSPDFESRKTVYEFTVEAAAVGGQLVNRKEVTINIQDVDEAPTGMTVNAVHDDNEFTPEELEQSANRKLAKIKFIDVDSQVNNTVEIDAASQGFFEIRQTTRADGKGYCLWVKEGVSLEAGTYSIIITPVIEGVHHEDLKKVFTFTVESPNAPDDSLVDQNDSNDMQSTDVVNFEGPLEQSFQINDFLSAEVL